jgi:hypothetical protein
MSDFSSEQEITGILKERLAKRIRTAIASAVLAPPVPQGPADAMGSPGSDLGKALFDGQPGVGPRQGAVCTTLIKTE